MAREVEALFVALPAVNPSQPRDDKFPPDRGDEPIDAEEQWEEREKKGRLKKKKKKREDDGSQGIH